MKHLVQLKDKNELLYPKSAIKQISNISICAGQDITDAFIVNAKTVMIYFTVNENLYISSISISNNFYENWFLVPIYTAAGFNIVGFGYIKISKSGNISCSPYSHKNFKIVGYDIMF